MYRAVGGQLPWCVEPGQPYDAGSPPEHDLTVDSSEAYAEAARVIIEDWGFRCLKLHVGMGTGLEPTSDVDRIEEAFAAVRRGAGPNVEVAVDLHNPHPVMARQLITALAPHRPLFIEEPMPVERVDVLAEIARHSDIPIAAGERWMGKWVFYDALRKNALTVLQPDLCHAGGITECHKIAVMGESAYAKLALHCPLSPLALAASIQIDACAPNFLVQEHNEVNAWREGGRTLLGAGYFSEPFELDSQGCVAVPEGPGLGVEIDATGFEKIMARPWRETRG
jgi:galactonate dehydratase